jgi:hypothetical protein
MTHPSEEDLLTFREGDAGENAAISEHLRGCDACRAEFVRLNAELSAVYAALDTLEVPEPESDYGQRVWREIASQLRPKLQTKLPSKSRLLPDGGSERVKWWQGLFVPRRLAAFAGVAALVVLAFFAGRGVRKPDVPVPNMTANNNAVSMREKVLLLAVGEHLGRSEMMLTELSNTEGKSGGVRMIDISAEQRRAEDLLTENRLYRETALEQGETRIADVLDELERVLLDVSHSPDEVTGTQLQAIRERMDTAGILFKVRVVGEQLKERQRALPAGSNLHEDRKKV